LSGPVGDDQRVSTAGWSENLNLAAHQDEERHDLISNVDERLTACDHTAAPMRRDSLDLHWCQRRE